MLSHAAVYPASHYVVSQEKLEKALLEIEEEMLLQVEYFKKQGKLLEAQRIMQRTYYDIDMNR